MKVAQRKYDLDLDHSNGGERPAGLCGPEGFAVLILRSSKWVLGQNLQFIFFCNCFRLINA